jgi:hypothetical protein
MSNKRAVLFAPAVFLPAAGYCNEGDGPNDVGNNGNYWSSTVNDGNNGFKLNFNSGNVNPENNDNRDNEYPVRAVRRSICQCKNIRSRHIFFLCTIHKA